MALEGGYNLNSISHSVLACVKTLLEEKPVDGCLEGTPFESTWRVIKEVLSCLHVPFLNIAMHLRNFLRLFFPQVRDELKMFWPILSVELPQDVLTSNSRPVPVEVFYSHFLSCFSF